MATVLKELFEKFQNENFVKEMKEQEADVVNGQSISVLESIICAGVLHDTL